MDNSNVELITKMVLEAVEKNSVWRRLPSYKVQRTYGWTVCIKRKGYNCWS